MRSSGTGLIVGSIGLLALAGCTGLGKDTLVFGTDTKLALDVSGDPSGQPSFTLGYKRRELIWLPLSSGMWGTPTHLCVLAANSKLLCESVKKDPTKGSHVCVATTATQNNALTASGDLLLCDSVANVQSHLYQGTSASGRDKDSYSVMASFGLDTYGTQGAKIAQFIATGIAARNLTQKGIAPLVNPEATVSEAALGKAIQAQEEQLDRIVKAVLVANAGDGTKLAALADKCGFSATAKAELLKLTGKSGAEVKKGLRDDYPSNLAEMDSFVTKGI